MREDTRASAARQFSCAPLTRPTEASRPRTRIIHWESLALCARSRSSRPADLTEASRPRTRIIHWESLALCARSRSSRPADLTEASRPRTRIIHWESLALCARSRSSRTIDFRRARYETVRFVCQGTRKGNSSLSSRAHSACPRGAYATKGGICTWLGERARNEVPIHHLATAFAACSVILLRRIGDATPSGRAVSGASPNAIEGSSVFCDSPRN